MVAPEHDALDPLRPEPEAAFAAVVPRHARQRKVAAGAHACRCVVCFNIIFFLAIKDEFFIYLFSCFLIFGFLFALFFLMVIGNVLVKSCGWVE